MLSLVVLCTLICGWFVLLPSDFKDFGRSIIAQSVFLSNVYFWLKSGYFTAPAETKPLLHTWALSVLEQFYLFLPLLLFVIRKYSYRFRAMIISCGIMLSFALCLWGTGSQPLATFFLLPTRSWELLTGVFIAVALGGPLGGHLADNRKLSEIASIVGLATIVYAIIVFDQNTKFPGAAALLPCFGSAAIIWANSSRPTLVGRLLALRPLVWTGLISYSLYLWHWPALVFARYVAPQKLSSLQSMCVVLLSAVMAWVSYKWIELPVRRCSVLRNNTKFIIAVSVVVVGLCICGIVITRMDGAPHRLSPAVYAAYSGASYEPPPRCKQINVSPHLRVCSNYDNSCPPDLIIWGDSHSVKMMPALEPVLDRFKIRFWHFFSIPVFEVYKVSDSNSLEGSQFYLPNKEMKEYLLHNHVSNVLLVSFWSQFTEGREIPMEGAGQRDPFYADSTTKSSTPAEARAVFRSHFLQTIHFLRQQGIEIWIMNEVPIHLYWVSNQLAKTLKYGGDTNTLGRPYSNYAGRTAFINSVFNEIKDNHVHLLDPADILCQNNFCHAAADGKALYSDFNHLSYYGAVSVLPIFRPLFQALGSTPDDHRGREQLCRP